MRDPQDQKMKELAYRLIDMAPEAPPFPEEPMVQLKNDPAKARSGSRRTLIFAASLASALVIGVAATTLLPRDDSSGPPGSPPVDFPNLTATFVSPMNGYSVNYPDSGVGTLTPATELWVPHNDDVGHGRDVVDTGLDAVFKGASIEVDDEVSIDRLVDDLFEDLRGPVGRGTTPRYACGVPRSQHVEITIDGQSGKIVECANEIHATVVAGGRLYLFTLLHTRSDARAVFDAFAATIDLTPETGAVFDVIEFMFDPQLATTFVSPTNGFSFRFARGGLTPAVGLWDPVSGAPHDDEFWGFFGPQNGFDALETGFGAVLKGASTEVPDGVAIDEWIDDVLEELQDGCGVPRSQQAEITIDGQSGSAWECWRQVEATVVAGGRLYLFVMLHSGATDTDARAFFDAFVATIDLRPEDAALPSSTP